VDESTPQPQTIHIALTNDARASVLHARVAVVASGTATLEAALIGTPFVMVYRLSPLTWALGRHLVKLPYFGIVNLIAGHEVVPELIQERFTPAAVACHVQVLLEEGPARARMVSAFGDIRKLLQGEAGRGEGDADEGASRGAVYRAARAVLRVLKASQTS
jgi:lipid-A-disaccharide synthase